MGYRVRWNDWTCLFIVSYDVTSLFTEIPLDESINHIIDQIYNKQKLPQITSRPIFKRLLERVTKDTTFTFNGKLYKQVDGCSMGNPLSPTLANIFMCKLEADVEKPLNLPFYICRRLLHKKESQCPGHSS